MAHMANGNVVKAPSVKLHGLCLEKALVILFHSLDQMWVSPKAVWDE